MKVNWYMRTLDAAPAMTTTTHNLGEVSYDEAKQIANNWVNDNGQSASLHSREYDTYAWYRINEAGHGWDRNTSGQKEVTF